MSIKNKSLLLVSIFVLILVLNALGIYISMSKIDKANKQLIEEARITKSFLELQYKIKHLQEISTDIALMGDKDGISEIIKIEKEYLEENKNISKLDISQENKKNLKNITENFDEFSKSLLNMAKAGIKRVEARKSSLNEMKNFDNAVNEIENSLTILSIGSIYKLKYYIVSIQEILTDALAIGDTSGFSEIDELQKKVSNIFNQISIQNPQLKSEFSNLSSKISKMIEAGKTMAQKGEIFNNQVKLTRKNMDIIDSKHDIIEENILKIVKNRNSFMQLIEKENLEIIATAEKILMILSFVFLISVIYLAIIIKGILSNIQKLDVGIANLLNPEVNTKVDIKTNDEIGNISTNFNTYIQSVQDAIELDQIAINEARKVMGKVSVGLYNDRIRIKASSKIVNRLIDAVNSMIDVSQKNMQVISKALSDLSNAKYDQDIPRIKGVTGLVAVLLDGTRIVQSTSNEVMALIDNSNKRLTFSAQDLDESSTELSKSANEQAAALEETAAAIEEVTSTIESNNENAVKMTQFARNVSDSSKIGVELANKTSVSMDELSNEVNTINEAISVIDQIAFQTNILSLNAAVEAATAGEAGKGFAVVAGEVRNLASRSAEAAKEIKELVESATQKAQSGKEVSNQMIEGFKGLDQNISETMELIDNVSTATREQKEAMVQINETINSLDRETQRNAAQASNISDMAKVTKQLAEQLQAAVDRTDFSQEAKRRVCDSDMIFDLNKLKTDHINFKNTNFSCCKAGDKFAVKSHEECDMGKWIIANENSELAQTELWEKLKREHQLVHHMVKDVVDLYADEYENGQIISVTENLESHIGEIFNTLDEIKEYNCDLQFQKRKGGE